MIFHKKPNKFVAAIELNVRNMEMSRQFYHRVLGFSILNESPEITELTVDGENPMITLNQVEHEPERRTAGLYHIALLLPERSLLGSFLAHMVQLGYPLSGGSDHGVSEAVYLNDPEGNGIEVYVDRSPDEWLWNGSEVDMYTKQLDAQGLIQAGQTMEWRGMPAGTVLGHIHLSVSDIDESRLFYTEILGYDVVCTYGKEALFLSTGRYHHHIAVNRWAGANLNAPESDCAGLASYTIKLDGPDDLASLVSRLNKIGLTYEEKGAAIELKDPSGIQIRLSAL